MGSAVCVRYNYENSTLHNYKSMDITKHQSVRYAMESIMKSLRTCNLKSISHRLLKTSALSILEGTVTNVRCSRREQRR